MALREKRYETIRNHTKYRDTIRYDMMHKRNDKFNALQHRRQFINERLLLLQQACLAGIAGR